MAPANETRGEISLSLEGVDYILRPSFEAISAFEAETGFGLLALTGQAEDATMTLDTMASIVTHCIRAHGDATGDQMLKSVNKPKIAALIMGSDGGMLGAIIRVRLLLVMAATGGFTASGEPKAAGSNGKTPVAS